MNLKELKGILANTKKKKQKIFREKNKPIDKKKQLDEDYKRAMKGVQRFPRQG